MDLSPETILSFLCLTIASLALITSSKSDVDDDEELVTRCNRGDSEAFNQLVLKYQKKVFNVAYRFVGDQEEANDLAQEIFAAAYQNLKKFRGDSKFSTWLFQIATNRGKNRFKYLKRRGFFVNKSSHNNDDDTEGYQRVVPDHTTNPENILSSRQIQKVVQDAIEELEPDHKEIVILRDIEGFSYEEIARMLDLPEGTTKSRLHRARMVIKEKLKKVLS
ncbi:MAG: sigma-70 family RNA polymerase sigma factor [Syntrophaceae bacterium]|mgnify:CR=1 FL=1|nr:sigma-70 family RNA polymerase sigma factor [Syntrophaceae bacterium]